MSTPIVSSPQAYSLPANERAFVKWNVYFGFAALSVGVLHGLRQALNYAGVDTMKSLPGMHGYYQGLTVHGVFNAIVLTFAFANGFMVLTTARGLGRKLNAALLHAALWTLVAGSVLAAYAIFTNRASVLYTFYPPLEAHWTFYLGLALVVVSTWLTSAALFAALRGWRKEHPGERIPLLAYMSIVTYVMWDIASLGIAIEVVVFLLPWSLGLIHGSDPLLSRTLFWYTGHPIVYYWLLPVYVSWYGMVPQQAGGKLFSDPLTRIAFLMFLCLSIPVGFHHQFSDPGISQTMKFIVAVLTFGVFFPSLMTAFSVMYALEIGGRKNGGTGLLGWFVKIPWKDPSLSAQVLAMLAFMLGGITGLINGSASVNQVVHNTAFIPGHFHLTIAAAVALSYMGIAYWLVPYLQDRALWSPSLARIQGWLYFVGVMTLSNGLMWGGLLGMPRRTMLARAAYLKFEASWRLPGLMTGVGGSLMFVSALLFFLIIIMTAFFGERGSASDLPLTETIRAAEKRGWQLELDKFRYWIFVTVLLIVIAYGPFIAMYLPPRLTSPGFQAF